jgi:NAD-dependent oxidoreductase involved in siderophore biosynthesis
MEVTPAKLVALYESAPDPPPLHGLPSVDWSAVGHAHGPATDTPALLRALMSADEDHREFACELLFETIWHQGNIYAATATAVPFLYNLLEADGPHDKQAIAHLVATIADGEPSFAMCDGNPEEAALWEGILRNVGRSLRDEMAAGRIVAEDVRRAVASRLDVLYP